MVKLVRLTSNDNGKFNADLDAGISVGENTQIAVQNLTAQTIFETLNITPNNHTVRSNLDTDVYSNISSQLETKQYNSVNHNDFFIDLEQTLNDTMRTSGQTAQNTIDNGGDVFRAVRVEYPNRTAESNDRVELVMKYTPLLNPFVYNLNLAPRRDEDDTTIFNHFGSVIVDTSATKKIDLGNLWQDGTATANRTNFFSPNANDVILSRGSGIWCCRVQNLIDNGGASNTNGWGIGLSWTRTSNTETEIANTSRDFEIRVQKPTDQYVYVTPANAYTEVATGVTPYSMITVAPNGGSENDQMVLWKNGTKLHLQIWNRDGAANGQVVWEHIYTLSKSEAQKPLYPYLYVCGNSTTPGTTQATDNIVGQPLIIIDPFFDRIHNFTIVDDKQNIDGTTNNWFDLLGNNMEDVIPTLNNDRFENINIMITYEWRMDVEVWKQLGFNTGSTIEGHYDYHPIPNIHPITSGEKSQQLRITLLAKNIYSFILSDNFIVMLDSNPLICYDASRYDYGSDIINADSQNIHRGRRQNILATIPTNDNNGIIEYNTNELVYIDLDNKYPQILKNLRLRILNKNFDEISTTGMSILTLLIK